MDGMMAGMKTQMVMMVPQMVIMGWINFFFQGFVLSELPPACGNGRFLTAPPSQAAIPADLGFQEYAAARY
jgi:Integral membrane protein EMC3/TMCO1-like